MALTRQCPRCGTELPADAAEGLCPRCVARLAFGDEPPAPPTGAKMRYFGDYELLEEIARGGMGVVFKARQLSLNRLVAVKMILRGEFAGETERQRFRAEAEAAANLQHPNIIAIHEVGEHDGQPYFSMDLVAGHNLAAMVKDKPLPARQAAAYLKTIAEAIHHAHEKGTLHRDLKPTNVLVDEFDQPRITDFGLAKRLNDSGQGTRSAELTQTGQMLGTPSFAPPEQAGGRTREIGVRSDVYSLGALLYFLLTTRPPFAGTSLEETLSQVLNSEASSPRALNPDVSRDLETICLKCLEKDPRRRYASAQELADELGRFLRDEPIHARPVSIVERGWRLCRRHRLITGFVIALALALVSVAWLIRERQDAARDENTPQMTSLPLLSGNGVAGNVGGKFYVVTPADGYSGKKRFFHSYDFNSNSWQRLSDTPEVFWDSAAGVIGGTLYIAGGAAENSATNSLWAYDTSAGAWSRKASMPTARNGSTAVVLNGRLFVIGGADGTNVLRAVESYDPASDRWQTETPLRTPRMYFGAAVLEGEIFIVGGGMKFGGASNHLATVESWRPGQAWVTQPPLLTPVSGAFVAAVGDTLYVAGGKAAFSDTDELQTYPLLRRGWIHTRPMPEVRYQGSGALVQDEKLFLFGGWNDLPGSGSLPHPDVFIYDTRRNSWARSK